MADPQSFGLTSPIDEGRRAGATDEPHPRAVGSPLPIGSGLSNGHAAEPQRGYGAPPPGRALANISANPPIDVPSGVQRVINAVRAALPYVQRILPLLDGNIGTAVGNMFAPHHHAAPPPPPVNLAPIEDGLANLQAQQRELRDQVLEQNSSLKRVEDQLEMVREATDRNTLEQQELMEDLKAVGHKWNVFALIALGLLAVSVIVNVVLYLHILMVLP